MSGGDGSGVDSGSSQRNEEIRRQVQETKVKGFLEKRNYRSHTFPESCHGLCVIHKFLSFGLLMMMTLGIIK